MEKFCTSCGKKLEEGKACDCTTKSVSSGGFMDDVKGILKDALKLFTKPTEVIEKKSVSKYTWIITMAIQTIALFLTLLIGLNAILETALGGMYSLGMGSVSLGDIPFGVYVKIFFAIAITALIFLFIFVTIIYLVVNKLFKVDCKYQDVLNKFSYPSLIFSAALLVGVILLYLHEYVGMAVIGFGTLYFVVITFAFIKSFFKLDDNKNLLFTPLLIMITSVLGSWVAQKIIGAIFKLN